MSYKIGVGESFSDVVEQTLSLVRMGELADCIVCDAKGTVMRNDDDNPECVSCGSVIERN